MVAGQPLDQTFNALWRTGHRLLDCFAVPGHIADGPVARHARSGGCRVRRGVLDLAHRDAHAQNR